MNNTPKGKNKFPSKYKILGKTRLIRIPECVYVKVIKIIHLLEEIGYKKDINKVDDILDKIINILDDIIKK